MKNKNKNEILEEYMKFKSTNVTTTGKLENYTRFVQPFLDISNKPLKDYQETELVNFINLLNKRYNVRSMNEVKTLIKNFIVWYYPDYPQRFRNMSALLRHLKVVPTYGPPDMLDKDQVEKIIKSEESFMWKTFWLVLYYGGMRPGETAKLEWKSITFTSDGAFIEVYVKKNQNKFMKFLPENVAFYLRKLKERSVSDLVFPSRVKKDGKDMPMQRSGIEKRLRLLSLKVLGKKVRPYLLRHSIATDLYNKDNVDKDFVAQQMGHTKNMESTYNHPTQDKIKEKLKKLYIATEELPPKEKHQLEEDVEQLKKLVLKLVRRIEEKESTVIK